MFAHDPQRTGWATEETTLNAQNVGGLKLNWKTHVDNQYYSLSAVTPPVVATDVETDQGKRSIVYTAGIAGTMFALDAHTGTEVWARSLKTMAVARKGGLQGTFLCPNGITATPAIDKKAGIIYVIAPDGALYGMDLATGRIRFGPAQFIAPFAKSWSLTVIDGVVYTTVSLGCGNGRAGLYTMDVKDPHHPVMNQVLLSDGYASGIWGRAGPVVGLNGKIYGGTAIGSTAPEKGDYAATVVGISQARLSVADYFLPPNYKFLNTKDLDPGSASPVWFKWQNRNLLAHGSKHGVLYLLDADNMGGGNHQTALFTTPKLGNEKEECCEGTGIWGALSVTRDEAGQTWLYVPMGGPPSPTAGPFPIQNGSNPHGSMMAFRVVADASNNPKLEPAWISGDFSLPDPAVIANGVVFALSNGENASQRGDESRRFTNTHPAVLMALDAKTGKELYNSGSSIGTWVHFSGLALADGRVFAVDHDSNVYSFGLDGPASGTLTSNSTSSAASALTTAPPRDAVSASWIGLAGQQDQIMKSWILRASITAAFGLLAAVAGLWFGLREKRT
jgi:outer membrane protein assembly factor BamB